MNLLKALAQKLTSLSDKQVQISIIPEPNNNDDPLVGSKGLIIDPFYEMNNSNANGVKTRTNRLSNKLLRDMSQRDWLVASILRTRCDTIASFANYSNDPLKPSYHFVRKDGTDPTAEDEKLFQLMADFLENVGFEDNVPHLDRQNLGDFFRQATRDALVYGYVPVEKIFTRSGGIHRFRARPADSFYFTDNKLSRAQIDSVINNARKQLLTINRFAVDNIDINQVQNDSYHYCQISQDGQVIAAFGESDLIWKNFGFQSGSDSVGYPVSHLEQAVKLITAHMNIDNYNEKIFTNGYAAKGILHLKGQVNQESLIQFRRQFHDSISSTENNWRTPIVSGMDEIQFVSLAPSSKDMEYMTYNKMIAMNLCSIFSINPEELGLEAISGQQRSASNSENTEFKIEHSKERGLEPLLKFFEDLLNNDIIASINKDFSKDYKLEFFLSEDSPASFAALLQAEMTTNSTYNDILRKSGKRTITHPIANLPLCQNFWQIVEKNMTRGEIREVFLGDKGASENPALQYIPGDPIFLQWQQFQAQQKQIQDQKEASTQMPQSAESDPSTPQESPESPPPQQ